MTKWVYNFGKSGTDGDTSMRNLLGGKGANLAEMSGIGLPVPPGFTISTDVCTYFYDNGRNYPDTLDAEVRAAIAKIESETGSGFADPKNPLLVSVRSGARASMPGMMDSILNIGLNDDNVGKLADTFDDERYKDFATRICGQIFPEKISSEQLLYCRNIVNDRFNNQGPWPDAQAYIDEGNELLSKDLDKNEKMLVNLAINSIKSSQSF